MHTPAEFDLDAVRAKLDEQGMTVAGNQEASLKSRRQLADVTKSALRPETNSCKRAQRCRVLTGYSEGIGHRLKDHLQAQHREITVIEGFCSLIKTLLFLHATPEKKVSHLTGNPKIPMHVCMIATIKLQTLGILVIHQQDRHSMPTFCDMWYVRPIPSMYPQISVSRWVRMWCGT